jgi:hypothetical protein
MFGDAAEHISEPGKRVGFRKFAGLPPLSLPKKV